MSNEQRILWRTEREGRPKRNRYQSNQTSGICGASAAVGVVRSAAATATATTTTTTESRLPSADQYKVHLTSNQIETMAPHTWS